jgi:hypothetical protein
MYTTGLEKATAHEWRNFEKSRDYGIEFKKPSWPEWKPVDQRMQAEFSCTR